MSTSFEAQLQSQAERSQRLRKIVLVLVVIIGVLSATLWFWVTQPLFGTSPGNTSAQIDPVRLENHVRMLSEQLVPRDQSRTDNDRD